MPAPPVPPVEVVPEGVVVVAVLVVGGAVVVVVGVLGVVVLGVVVLGVVTVGVVGVVGVVIWVWQSLAARLLTVVTPCLRLFMSVELTDAGRFSTAFVNPVAAFVTAPQCPEATAAETWSSWLLRLLA
jgi:hypothetical protein